MKRIWCYVLGKEGVEGLRTFDSVPVEAPALHTLYECDSDNPNVGNTASKKLYHAKNSIINEADLKKAISAHDKHNASKNKKVTNNKTDLKKTNNVDETKSIKPKG